MSSISVAAHPKVFISYSRRDFALAEAVAATLNEQGHTNPWLDTEKLEPGMNWDAAIEHAIDDAEILLLIASPAALASPYVTEEWKRAIEGHKNIHVCVVEAVDLPAELVDYPVHDLRSQFWRRTREVGDIIAARGTTSTAPTRRLNLVPAPVAALLAAALAITVVSLWAALETWHIYGAIRAADGTSLDLILQDMSLVESIAFVGLGLTMLVVAAQVLWRRSSGSALSYNFGFAAICGWCLLLFWPMSLHFEDPELAVAFTINGVLGTVLLVASAVGGGLMLWSRTVYLWLPTGEGYYQVRQRILRRKVQRRRRNRIVNSRFEHLWAPYAAELAALPAEDTATTFEIRCDKGDEEIKQLIRCACQEAGLMEATSEATWVLRLVSSKTDYAAASEEIRALGARAICILVDSVPLPEDSMELRRRQWLDFREQLPEGLYNLLRELRNTKHAAQDSNPIPIDTSRFRAPLIVRGFVELARTYMAIIGAFSIGLLALRPLQLSVVALALMSLSLDIYLWLLLRSTTARSVTAKRFHIRCGMLFLFTLIWTGYLGVLNPSLLILGMYVPIGMGIGMIRVLRHLPGCWLPSSVTAHRTTAVVPSVLTSYVLPLAVMSFGLAVIASELMP